MANQNVSPIVALLTHALRPSIEDQLRAQLQAVSQLKVARGPKASKTKRAKAKSARATFLPRKKLEEVGRIVDHSLTAPGTPERRLVDELRGLKDALSRKDEEVRKLEGRLSETQKMLLHKDGEVERLKQDVAARDEFHRKLAEQIARLERERDGAKARQAATEQRANELTQQKDKSREVAKAIRRAGVERRRKLEEQIAHLQRQLEMRSAVAHPTVCPKCSTSFKVALNG